MIPSRTLFSGWARVCAIVGMAHLATVTWAASPTPATGDRVVIQLPFKHGFQFAGYYAAQMAGYFQEVGLDVELRPAADQEDPADEVIAGRADYGVLGAEVLMRRLNGDPLVLVTTVYQHSAFGLLVRADSSIRSPSDLVGRRVALSEGPRYAELWAMLFREGIRRERVVIVPERWHVNEVRSGEADATAAFFANFPQVFQEEGEYRVILPRNYGIDFYGDGLFTSEREARRRRDRVEAMQQAVIKGWTLAMRNPESVIDYMLREMPDRPPNLTQERLRAQAHAVQQLVAADLVEVGHVNQGRWAEIGRTFVELGMAPDTKRMEGFLGSHHGLSARTYRWLVWGGGAAGFVALIAFATFLWNVRLRRQIDQRTLALRRSERRFREVFNELPVAILEEDFTEVRRMLMVLKQRGVTDLGAYLEAHPAFVHECYLAIRITGANDAAVRMAGVATAEELRTRVAAVYSPGVDAAVRAELDAVWTDRRAISREMTHPVEAGQLRYSLMHWTVLETTDGQPDWGRVIVAFSDLTDLRQTEARLRSSEDRWELAVRGLNVGLYEFNFETGQTFYSERWKEIIGCQGAEIGSSRDEFWSRVHPDDLADVRARLEAHLDRREGHYRAEFRMRRKDGTYAWVLSRGLALFQDNGQPVRIVGSHSDITERKEAEEALRASESRWQAVVRATQDGIWDVDLVSGAVYHSERLKQMLGYGSEEFPDTRATFDDHLHPDDRKRVLGDLEEHLAGRTPVFRVEGRMRCKDGSYRWVLGRGQVVADVKGRRTRFIGSLTDITELKSAVQALRASEERWQLALRGSQDGIWEHNFITGENHYSDRWKEMLGFEPDEIGHTWEDFADRIHPADRDMVMGALEAHNRGETPLYTAEFRMACKDGAFKWILARGQALFDGDGHALRIAGSHTDVSERKAAEQALRVSEERYRRLFESNPSPMWVYDVETLRFLEVNAAAEHTYGHSRAAFLGMTVLDIWPPEERMHVREKLEQWGEHNPQLGGVWRHHRRDGSLLYVVATAHRHEFAGRPGMLVLTQDITERYLGEERLRVSEARYRALFESAVEGVYECAADGHFRAVNPALARLLGHASPAEMMEHLSAGRNALYVLPNRHREFIQALGNSDVVIDFESEVRCSDGSTKWISENARAFRNGGGDLVYLQGFVSDITERRRSEAALRASEERYRILFEHSPVAIVEYDYRAVGDWIEGLRDAGVADIEKYLAEHPHELSTALKRIIVVGMNEAMVKLVGGRSKQDVANQHEKIFAEDSYLARHRAFAAIWEGKTLIEGEFTLCALDGSTRRAYYRWWLPVRGGRLDLEWTQLVLVDLTDFKRTEAALAAERERLSVTLRAMAEGVVTTDMRGVVQFINHAAEELVGWAFGGAVGHSIDEIVVLRQQKSRAEVVVPVQQALAEHRVVDLPLPIVLLDRTGQTRLVEGRCAPLFSAQGEPMGAVLVIRDIAERARLEDEMLRASKLESVGILAGGIAHDFNNILTVVMGNLTLAQLDSQVMAAAGHWLQESERGVMRARDLTQQLLTFAKGGDPIRSAVRLQEVVRESASFALHGSKVRCEFDIEPTLWPADVDKGQIGQVVQNLVINAVQAMPEGGKIFVQLRNFIGQPERNQGPVGGRYVRINLTDTGVGIRQEHLARIFDPYFTTKQSGSGLGLATVYSIIRKHQGHIEVESELGKGTTFRLWLPAATSVPTTEKPSIGSAGRLAGRVLFMDDEDTIRRMAQALLGRLGFDVVTVADGAAAVRVYGEALKANRPFRVVVMDLTVPGGMGGRQAMEELLKLDPRVRAIVSSGYSSDPVLANYRQHGFKGVVAKPYRLTDLAKVMRAVLDER